MHRDGADKLDMQPTDFVCDFTGKAWDGSFPMVEGHQGSLICGDALSVAYTEVVVLGNDSKPAGATCSLCLEARDDPGWQSPVPVGHHEDGAVICRRCIRQSATRLHKDPDWAWQKPAIEN